MEVPVFLWNDDADYAVCGKHWLCDGSALGGYMAIKGSIEVGQIQSFFQYIRNFTQPIQQIAQVTNMLQSTAAASERVFEFLEEEEEEQTVKDPVHIDHL